jgi:hypothetical protein
MKQGGADPIDIVLHRENYFYNRKISLEQFRSNLEEQKNKFAVDAVFRFIIEQERFIQHITKNKHTVAKPKDEEKFLELLIGEAKKVFGKEYDKLYTEIKTECIK